MGNWSSVLVSGAAKICSGSEPLGIGEMFSFGNMLVVVELVGIGEVFGMDTFSRTGGAWLIKAIVDDFWICEVGVSGEISSFTNG